ncbi:ASI1-immunoprecipitated protein 1 [Cardamine amara subsp. amara]|uniref:ASI1-immunoprecipitated protein 1 n=1 Tax=Cardamine amara subsp. amara TaxID=228776 RepID=A0ABD1A5Q2_CARAN
MANPEEVAYEKFLEKVRRTVYIDELTPLATKPVIESAFNQFGTVENVCFLPNYLGPKELPLSVLVQMQTEDMAKEVISTVTQFPFMVAGMPRPVRASAGELEMFDNRPKKPGRKIRCRWMDRNDPDFDKAKKMKRLVRKHSAETSFMLKKQLEEAEKLSKQQAETAITHHKKYEMMDKLLYDGVAQKLADRYNMRSFPHR